MPQLIDQFETFERLLKIGTEIDEAGNFVDVDGPQSPNDACTSFEAANQRLVTKESLDRVLDDEVELFCGDTFKIDRSVRDGVVRLVLLDVRPKVVCERAACDLESRVMVCPEKRMHHDRHSPLGRIMTVFP